jgi:transcriptional regulator with XRE-family HTH domain
MGAVSRFAVLVVAGFILAGPGFGWVYTHFGSNAVLVLVFACGAMAVWLGHTPETREWAERVIRVLGKLGISQKSAALCCRMTQGQFSDWLSGREKPNPLRLRAIGPEFNGEMAADECESHGMEVLRRGEGAQLVRELRALRASKGAA